MEELDLKIKELEQKLEILSKVDMPPDQKAAFLSLGDNGIKDKPILEIIGETVKDVLSKKEKELEAERNHELAIITLEMNTLEKLKGAEQVEQFDNYLKDKQHQRETKAKDDADKRTKHIIMRTIQFTFLVIAYYFGGMPFVLGIISKVFGG